MAKSPTHLAQEISARRVALYHSDAVEALRLYYTPGNPQFLTRFFGKSLAEISVERDDRLQETDFRSSLAVLAQIEATFRVDYRNRCETGRKDSLSKSLRLVYKKRRLRADLEDDILSNWRLHHPELGLLVSQFKGALSFRHWLAHGMYWQPNLARRHDFQELFALAEAIISSFPFLGRR